MYINRLQEYCQKNNLYLPNYTFTSFMIKDKTYWTACCHINTGTTYIQGWNDTRLSTKKNAKMEAAQSALSQLHY